MGELGKEEVKWWYQAINHGTAEKPDLRVHEVYFNTITKREVAHTIDPVKLDRYESKGEIMAVLKMVLSDLKRAENSVLDIEKVNRDIFGDGQSITEG